MKRLLAASLAALLLAPAAAFAQALPYYTTGVPTNGVTSATIGTFTTAKAQETGGIPLRGCQLTNTGTVAINVSIETTPTVANARPLAAGATLDCGTAYGTIIVNQISLAPTTAVAQTWVLWTER